jgi:hypothetical protein
VGFDEDLLGHVPCLLAIPYEMVGEGENLVAITLYEHFESVSIAGFRTSNQLDILGIGADRSLLLLLFILWNFAKNRCIQCDTQLSILLTR